MRYCSRGTIGAAPAATTIDRERRALSSALTWFTTALARGYAGQADMLGRRMADLARQDAFTRLDWSGSGSSPAHWQANLLKNIAMGVNIVDRRGTWTGTDRTAVIEWGNDVAASIRSSRSAGRHADWPDTDIATGTAYLMWGIASRSEQDFLEGLALFDKVARQIGPNGETAFYLKNPSRYANSMGQQWLMALDDKTIGDMVLAAHSARAVGIDLFNRKVGDATLYEAVVAWQALLFGTPTTLTEGQRRDFLSTSGGERSWAWTEYFISNFPSDPQTARLRAENRRIAGGSGYSAQAQGPSSCLVR